MFILASSNQILDVHISHKSQTSVYHDDIILDVIGNNTRRKILEVLAREPMCFNQLAREIDVGQKAILRHMKTLEDLGLIESYVEKSIWELQIENTTALALPLV